MLTLPLKYQPNDPVENSRLSATSSWPLMTSLTASALSRNCARVTGHGDFAMRGGYRRSNGRGRLTASARAGDAGSLATVRRAAPLARPRLRVDVALLRRLLFLSQAVLDREERPRPRARLRRADARFHLRRLPARVHRGPVRERDDRATPRRAEHAARRHGGFDPRRRRLRREPPGRVVRRAHDAERPRA